MLLVELSAQNSFDFTQRAINGFNPVCFASCCHGDLPEARVMWLRVRAAQKKLAGSPDPWVLL